MLPVGPHPYGALQVGHKAAEVGKPDVDLDDLGAKRRAVSRWVPNGNENDVHTGREGGVRVAS